MQMINAAELEAQLKDHNVVLIDIRGEREYAAEHIPGAMLLPSNFIDNHLSEAIGDAEPVFYCASGLRTEKAAPKIENSGLRTPKMLSGGLNAWRAAGLPVSGAQSGGTSLSVPRQVQISIGLMIVMLSALVYFGFSSAVFLVGAIGLGLLYAGLSGTCALASALMLMPWNKSRG